MQTNLFSLGQILHSFDFKSKLNMVIDDSIFLVQKGSVDLYAIETKEDLTHQKKIFLTNRSAGELIFPFSLLPKDIIIEADVEADSIIRKISIKEINDNLKTIFLSDLAKQIDSWILDIMARLIITTPPHAQIYISNQNNFTQSFELLQTTEIRGPSDKKSKDQITWIKINKGELFLFDQKNMVVTEKDTPFPMTYLSWIQAENYFQVTSLNTETILTEYNWQTILFNFHLNIAKLVIIFLEKKQKEELKRYRIKNKLEYNFLQKAIYKIVSIF
ncbi:MAG: hypothetical protein HZB76_06950 [Chlamydiae bacterium]|nr:hypothetical protein [Chlamydiota bacterium]